MTLSQRNLAIVALLIGCVGIVRAEDAIRLGQWQMNRGEGPVPLQTKGGGDPVAYTKMKIPAADDPGWEPAPVGSDGEVNFDEKSAIPCNQQVDFTYFQNTVYIPENVEVSTFSVSYNMADDGARIYVFNSKNPTGAFDEKADLTRSSKPGSINLASLMAKGSNRIVIAQYDDCKVLNRVKGIKINANGTVIQASGATEAQPGPTTAVGGASGAGSNDSAVGSADTAPSVPRSQPPLTKITAVSDQPGADRNSRVVFTSSDGSAAFGSRSVFILRHAASGESILVPVDGNEAETRTEVFVSSGTYEVTPPAPSVNGFQSFYTTKVSATRVTANAGADPAVVDFSLAIKTVPVAMRTSKVASDSVSLDWDALPDVRVQTYTLVRTDGETIAASETAGTVVTRGDANVKATVAKGLAPNRKYTFTLFSKGSDGKDLPIRSITASTSRKVGVTESSYALAPNAIVPDDFASLRIEPVSETSIRVTLPANVKRASGSGLPGVPADSLKGNGCVVGTPFLVTTDVAGDQSFYGLIDACEGPATGATTAIVNRNVPLVAVFNYFKVDSGDEEECFDALTGNRYPAGSEACTTLVENSAPADSVPAASQPPAPGNASPVNGPTLPFTSVTNLVREQRYWSQDGKHYLVFQADGNLVVYRADRSYVWGLDRQPKVDFRRIARVTWQADGNLAAYTADNKYIWSALHQNPDPKAQLVISPEGVLQIVSGTRVMWSASTPLSLHEEKIGEYAQTLRSARAESPEVILVANSRVSCQGSGSSYFKLNPSIQPLKKFDLEVSMWELKWNIQAGVKASFNPSAEITGNYECSLKLPELNIPIGGAAVPISLRLKPDISATASASLKMNGPSLTLDLGVESKGRVFVEKYDCGWFSCSRRMKTEKNTKPIAKFSRGKATANLSGTLTFRAGVDANLGFGYNVGIAKARAGFSLVLSPASMELKGQAGTSSCVSASLGYQIDAQLVSEVYLPLLIDEERKLPLYQSGHVAYPKATFMLGSCGD